MTTRRARVLVLAAAILSLVATACQFTASANRFVATPGSGTEPWWCRSGGSQLTGPDCQALSVQLDVARAFAYQYPHASDATAAGATSSPYVQGVGAAFRFSGPTADFAADRPDTLRYDGTSPTAQLATMEWNVQSGATPPAGFAGDEDHWTGIGGGVWQLRAWIIRPFPNQPQVFATSHPCLGATQALYDVTDACYTSTHPEPLRVVVTNDDGYAAPGIDAAVEELLAQPHVAVTVVAPATNQSGAGNSTTPPPLTASAQHTLSGYPATAVNGTPVDSVLYALGAQLRLDPDLVVSGINDGQNLGPVLSLSGTVGAARAGARHWIPALAISQGFGSPPDFAAGAGALGDWVTGFLLGRAGRPFERVTNVNVPTCTAGTIRGTAHVPAGPALNGRPYGPSNCLSTGATFADDVDAFDNGFIAVSNIGVG
jgi:5'-nucleotidase